MSAPSAGFEPAAKLDALVPEFDAGGIYEFHPAACPGHYGAGYLAAHVVVDGTTSQVPP